MRKHTPFFRVHIASPQPRLQVFSFSLWKCDYMAALLFIIWIFFLLLFFSFISILFLTCAAEAGAILPASLEWQQALRLCTPNRKWWQALEQSTVALVLMKYFIPSDIIGHATLIKASFFHWICVEADRCYLCAGTPHSDICGCAKHNFLHFMGIRWCLCIIKRA